MDNLEQEIAELQKKIEEKRNLLEQQGGIIEEKELVSEAVREVASTVSETRSEELSPVAPAKAEKAKPDDASYLDLLDEESVTMLNDLITKLPEIGLAKTVAMAESYNIPYLVDALHDVLVDRLYDELKSRGFVK